MYALIVCLCLAAAGDSCCGPEAVFADFGSDPAFLAAHTLRLDAPPALTRGEWISEKTAAGAVWRGWLVRPKEGKPKAGVIMIHEWWGLNQWIQLQAQTLADEGYAVLAVDLYGGTVAKTPQEAAKTMQAVKSEEARAALRAGIDYLRGALQVNRVGAIGWCFGGGWSLQTALLGGADVQACVIYYGMPETDAGKLKSLKAPVLGIFAKQDGFITPEVVGKFEAAMKEAGKPVTVYSYDAVHAFANPSNAKYDKKHADASWRHTLDFFKTNLKP